MKDFRLMAKGTGIELYRHKYRLVQVIHLDQGARVHLLHGGIKAQRPGAGVWGGDDPKFIFRPLATYWRWLRAEYASAAFSIVNGMFWRVGENPTRFALPVKTNGVIISTGFDISYVDRGKALMLELFGDHADIRDLTRDELYNSPAADIIGGLNSQASRRKMDYTGRTMVGVDESGHTLYLFSSVRARQNEGFAVLKRYFGAVNVIQFDGGGSSQLMVRGKTLVRSTRAIPQAIAVVAGFSS